LHRKKIRTFGIFIAPSPFYPTGPMFRRALIKLFDSFGLQVIRQRTGYSPQEWAIIQKVQSFTGSTSERLIGLINSVRYLSENRIAGDIVECGVWRGGSMMAAALALVEFSTPSRDLYLYDTFEGMTRPTEDDKNIIGQSASELLAKTVKRDTGHGNVWCIAGLEDVRRNMFSTGYPEDRIRFIKGPVEETIPQTIPDQIALLRLDTDWYASTAHELKYLYPRLVSGGVLILDDYGHWLGARKAVDEYFGMAQFRPFMNKLDYTGRLIIKP
jgi:O-methyltransferase